MFTNETSKKFTGNISLYAFHARYRQRIFLQRNIDRALQYNEELLQRRGEASLSDAAARQLRRDLPGSPHPTFGDESDAFPTRTRPRINEIANRLKTEIAITGKAEPVLKIDLNSLRGRSDERSNSLGASDTVEGSIRVAMPKRRPKTLRCKCMITIFGKTTSTDSRTKSKAQDRTQKDRTQLFRDSELCTIIMDPEDPSMATLQLDDPIYIKASKLFVLTYRGPIKCYSLAESYYSQITLSAIDPDQMWPPPLLSDIEGFIAATGAPGERVDQHSIHLIATFPNLPQVPKKGEYLRMAVMAGPRRCDSLAKLFELQVDCGWSNPFSTETSAPETQISQVHRLPTPNSEKDVSPSLGVPVNYHFRKNTQDTTSIDAVPGVNGVLSGYSKFTVKGYVCPLCDRKEFRTCNRLHFHLVTCHDLFEFQVKQKKSPRGTDAFADIWTDLSKKYSGVVSEKTKDPRAFVWIRPKEPFILKQILDGDWRWLNEKNLPPLPQQLQLHRERGALAGEKRFNVDDVRELQSRKRRRFIIPKALHKLKGPVFIRGKSKRFCYEGEELSESDEDADEDWLQMKHEETIDDFEDVGVNEQTFMKMFDRHLFKERPIAYCHLPETLVRFARSHRERLRSTNQSVEFFKHLLNLIQFGIIDSEILQHCMQIVKGNQWNCTETATVGLGMAGPLPLDDIPMPPRPIEIDDDQDEDSAQGDAMDIDVKEEAPEMAPEDISYMPSQSSGCPCNRPFKRAEVIYCDGQKCGYRWFHMSCVNLDHRVPLWKCKICQS
ncbi:VEFS-Box of polycomb protein-domain-containing protein [Peziza echinospora]|nr:VEFS-Box of polycomb protein-domain-containing protein [Peziza echinospora]